MTENEFRAAVRELLVTPVDGFTFQDKKAIVEKALKSMGPRPGPFDWTFQHSTWIPWVGGVPATLGAFGTYSVLAGSAEWVRIPAVVVVWFVLWVVLTTVVGVLSATIELNFFLKKHHVSIEQLGVETSHLIFFTYDGSDDLYHYFMLEADGMAYKIDKAVWTPPKPAPSGKTSRLIADTAVTVRDGKITEPDPREMEELTKKGQLGCPYRSSTVSAK
jgi:hypothetical protein